ncbi:MAG: hypothetical protein QOI53_1502, partial [Verrucomicrobiota bacterium]|nr:hypothetical protein [Verrucomicrobiota bacterium]
MVTEWASSRGTARQVAITPVLKLPRGNSTTQRRQDRSVQRFRFAILNLSIV